MSQKRLAGSCLPLQGPEVDPSHQPSQPGGAANFSAGTGPAALPGFCWCTRQSCSVGAPSTTGDVSGSRGPALMPSCVAGNEFPLYSVLSIPAGPGADRQEEMLPFAAPHPGASNPGQKPGPWSSKHNKTSILSLESLKAASLGCGEMNTQLLELSQKP